MGQFPFEGNPALSSPGKTSIHPGWCTPFSNTRQGPAAMHNNLQIHMCYLSFADMSEAQSSQAWL